MANLKNRKLSRYRKQDSFSLIDVQIRNLEQIYDSNDPAPSSERDLSTKVVEYLVSSIEELGLNTPSRIVIHCQEDPQILNPSKDLEESIQNYFASEATVLKRKVGQSFKQGRVFLLIGFTTLFSLLTVAELLSNYDLPFKNILKEGLVITGWVTMWKPLEVFLYDWRPIHYKQKCYEMLSKSPVDLKIQNENSPTKKSLE